MLTVSWLLGFNFCSCVFSRYAIALVLAVIIFQSAQVILAVYLVAVWHIIEPLCNYLSIVRKEE